LLPAYPGAALLLGSQIERWLRAGWHPRLVWGAVATGVLGCLGWWLYYVDIQLPGEEATREYRTFAADIRERVPAPETVWLFRTESHTLAFHLSQRVRTFVEWKDLDRLASGSKPAFVVMRPETAAECHTYLRSGDVEQVSSTDRDGVQHEKPLVLMRTRAKPTSSDYVRRE
jgi:hypothetical protein